MSLRRRRVAATLLAAFGLAGAAVVSTLGTGTVLAGCPEPRTCGEPSFARHTAMIAAVAPAGRPRTQVIECPDPTNCTPPH